MLLHLPDEAATLALGRALAASLPLRGPYPAVLLAGDLGAGKTTLVRGLAEALPGGPEAEVASPSFNIVNYYPTTPPVAHFDLYRLEGQPPGEEFHDAVDNPAMLVVAEWSQHLAPADRPGEALLLALDPAEPGQGGRRARLQATGPLAQALLDVLRAAPL